MRETDTTMTSSTWAQRKSLFWRLHLWAAFLATPFALVGTLTGVLYIFTPQIEAVLHGHLDRVVPAGAPLKLDALVSLAQQAAPRGAALRYVVTPEAPTESVRVYFSAPVLGHGKGHDKAHMDHHSSQTGSTVYLNPYSGDVLGVHGEMDRFGTWSKRLHSSLLQGNDWRWMLELSASWLLVMLLTGVYLWWPRGEARARPVSGLKGRMAWKQWHALAGVALSLVTFAILITGLTWSRHAGQQIKTAVDWVGQKQPEAPKGLRSTARPGQTLLGWQEVWDVVRSQAPRISYQLTPPTQADAPWRVTNFDRSQPTKRFSLLLDGYNGQRLHHTDWDSLTLFNKATAVGIPFHRGEFGWWNQALLLVFGLGMLWAVVSGWVMFGKRNRQGWLGLPRVLPGAWRSLPLGAWGLAVLLLAAMPLLALSACGVVVCEAWVAWQARRAAVFD